MTSRFRTGIDAAVGVVSIAICAAVASAAAEADGLQALRGGLVRDTFVTHAALSVCLAAVLAFVRPLRALTVSTRWVLLSAAALDLLEVATWRVHGLAGMIGLAEGGSLQVTIVAWFLVESGPAVLATVAARWGASRHLQWRCAARDVAAAGAVALSLCAVNTWPLFEQLAGIARPSLWEPAWTLIDVHAGHHLVAWLTPAVALLPCGANRVPPNGADARRRCIRPTKAAPGGSHDQGGNDAVE